MAQIIYRYQFQRRVSVAAVESSWVLALLAAEGLFGQARLRLETSHLLDRRKRVCVIRTNGEAGQAANRMFVSFLAREFGDESFKVESVGHGHANRRRPETAISTAKPECPETVPAVTNGVGL